MKLTESDINELFDKSVIPETMFEFKYNLECFVVSFGENLQDAVSNYYVISIEQIKEGFEDAQHNRSPSEHDTYSTKIPYMSGYNYGICRKLFNKNGE